MGKKMEGNEGKYSIPITTEETTLELFICESAIINIAAKYVNS